MHADRRIEETAIIYDLVLLRAEAAVPYRAYLQHSPLPGPAGVSSRSGLFPASIPFSTDPRGTSAPRPCVPGESRIQFGCLDLTETIESMPFTDSRIRTHRVPNFASQAFMQAMNSVDLSNGEDFTYQPLFEDLTGEIRMTNQNNWESTVLWFSMSSPYQYRERGAFFLQ